MSSSGYHISAPVELDAPGPVELLLTDTTAANPWKLATDLAGDLNFNTPIGTILKLFDTGGAQTQRLSLLRGANTVTLDTDPALATNYTYNMPASPPTGPAQIIASSGITNVFYDVHPMNMVVVRRNPGPGEFSSVAAAIASIPVNPAPNYPQLNNTWVVKIYEGTYLEPSFTVPAYVYLVGQDMRAVKLSPAAMGSTFITISGQGGMALLSIFNADPNFPAVQVTNCDDYSLMFKIEFEGCERCMRVTTDNSATSTSYFYGEFIGTSDASKYSLLVEDTGGTYGSVASMEDFFVWDHNDEAVIIDGSKSQLIAQTTQLQKDTAGGKGFSVKNSGKLDLRASYITGYDSAIYTPNDATVPTLLLSGVTYEGNVLDLDIQNLNTQGRNEGYVPYLKANYPKPSPFFVTNVDQHIITVAPKGANFTSIAAALAAITDNSPTNNYVISIGPGLFVEPPLTLKPYVILQGTASPSTIILALSPLSTLITGVGNSGVFDLTVSGDNPMFPPNVYPPWLIEYLGDPLGKHFRVEGVNFGTGTGLVHVGSSLGPAIYIQQNCIVNMQSAITNGIFIEDSGPGPYPIGYLISGMTWNPVASAFVNIQNFFHIHSFATGLTVPNIFGTINNIVIGQRVTTAAGMAIQTHGSVFLVLANVSAGGFNKGMQVTSSAEINILITSGFNLYYNTIDIDIQSPSSQGTLIASAAREKIIVAAGATIGITVTTPDGSEALSGQLYQGTTWSRVTNITEQIQHAAAIGVVDDRPIMTPAGGLNLTVTGGTGYVFIGPVGDNYLKQIIFPTATVALNDNTINYIYVDETETIQVSTSEPDFVSNNVLGTAKTNAGNITYTQEICRRINQLATRVDEAMDEVFGPIVKSGLIGTPGSSLTERAVAISSGVYYLGSIPYPPTAGDNIPMITYYGGANEGGPITNLPLQWDNAGVLTALGPSEWTKHSIYLISTIDLGVCMYFMVYGQEIFASELLAGQGNIPEPPVTFVENMIPVVAVIINGADPDSPLPIGRFQDIRPTLAFKPPSFTGTNDHNSLLNLTVGNAHPQYFRVDGTSTMTGNVNLGTQNIIGVGGNLLMGVDITNHAARHLPGGADPLTTDVPVNIGTSNQLGAQAAFARSDHVHNHGAQTDPTQHALATGLAAGFMSSADFTKLANATPFDVPSTLVQRSAAGMIQISELQYLSTSTSNTVSITPNPAGFGGPNHVLTFPVPAANDQFVLENFATTLSNKSLVDASTFITDDLIPSKRFRFENSSISPASTRVLTIQDQDYVVVGRDTTDTLTNKTILGNTNTVATNFVKTTGTDVNVVAAPPSGSGYSLITTSATTATWQLASTLTSITAGTGLTGGTITTSGTIALSIPVSIANGGTNSTTALFNNRIMVSSGGAIVESSALTDGQLLIGSTGGAPVVSTITAGTGITIVNGPGSITISATGTSGVSTFQTSLSGLSPSVATSGAVTLSGVLNPTSGGTGASSAPSDGQILIGSGGVYTPALITGGSGISVSSGAGSITITNTGPNGTVTSVALAAPAAVFTVSGSPVLTAGTLTLGFQNQLQNLFFASPSGATGQPSFRSMVVADLPTGIPNANLANSSITINTAGSLSGGGVVSLGGTITITGTTSGTVTSVALTAPVEFSVAGSPITSSGTLAITKANQTANFVWAGPTSGVAAQPTFRALVINDLPNSIPNTKLLNSSITINTAGGITGGTTVALGGTITLTGSGGTVTSITAGTGLSGGTITTTGTIAIANTTVTAGTYTYATLTVNAQGQLTSASSGVSPVTSVALSAPSIFTVSGSPVTGTGTLTFTSNAQSANTVYAGPTTGVAAVPTFRGLVIADLPTNIPNANLANSSITINTAGGITGGTTVSLGGTITLTGSGGTVTSITAGTGLSGGTITTSGTIAIANTGVTAATYTYATVTVNAQGQITSASSGVSPVTSVALSAPSIFTVSGSPVTSTGTLTFTSNVQNANVVYAGPTTGIPAIPTFRGLVVADLPTGIPNANLANSSITINTAGGITGGATVSLGGTITLTGSGGTVTSITAGTGLSGGTITTTGTIAIANTGVTAATYTYATVTVNAQGQITTASSGTAPVTSVGLAAPVEFTVSGSPVTSTGTLTFTKATQAANLVWAGPTTGAAAQPTFRALVAADIPATVSSPRHAILITGSRFVVTTTANTIVASMPWDGSLFSTYNTSTSFFMAYVTTSSNAARDLDIEMQTNAAGTIHAQITANGGAVTSSRLSSGFFNPSTIAPAAAVGRLTWNLHLQGAGSGTSYPIVEGITLILTL